MTALQSGFRIDCNEPHACVPMQEVLLHIQRCVITAALNAPELRAGRDVAEIELRGREMLRREAGILHRAWLGYVHHPGSAFRMSGDAQVGSIDRHVDR